MNQLVTFFRQQNPSDTRTDDEVTLGYAQEHGADRLASQYPDFAADYQRIVQAAFPPSIGDYAKQAVGSVIRGGASTIASTLEAPAVLAAEIGRRSVPEFDPAAPAEPFEEASGIPGLARSVGSVVSPEPVEGLEKSFLATKVPSALGSTGALMVGGVAGAVAKIPATLGIALLGAASQTPEGYHDAIRHGASYDQALNSAILNGIVGTSEAVPLGNILNRLNTLSGGTLKQAIKTAGKESFEESLQEAFQGVAGDVIAKNIVEYDKDRQLFEDTIEQGAIGGISGAVVSLLASAIGAKLNRIQVQPQPLTPPVEPSVTSDIGSTVQVTELPSRPSYFIPDRGQPVAAEAARAAAIGLAEEPLQELTPLVPEIEEPGLIVEELPDGFRISGLSVPESERGKGVGTGLVRSVMDRATKAGKPIVLTAVAKGKENQPALNRFYERLGFKQFRNDPLSGNPMYRWDPAPTGPAPAKTPKSSTQLTLPVATAEPFKEFARQIPDSEVYHRADETGRDDFGIETEPHITVLYGLTEHTPEPIRRIAASQGPITVTLGKLSIFEQDEYDVLKVDVTGDDSALRALNAEIKKLPNEQTFPDYTPHLTLAYLKKGEGKKYVDGIEATWFFGQKLTFDTLTFSPPSQIRDQVGIEEIPLSPVAAVTQGKGPAPAVFAGYADSPEGEVARFELTEPVGNNPAGSILTATKLQEAGYNAAELLAQVEYQRAQLDAQRAYWEQERAELAREIESTTDKKIANKRIKRLTFVVRKLDQLAARREETSKGGTILQLDVRDVDTFHVEPDVVKHAGRLVYPSFFQVNDESEAGNKLSRIGKAFSTSLGELLVSGARAEGDKSARNSKRITVFRGKGTDILALGTHKSEKGEYMVANPLGAEEDSIRLEELMSQGYTPVASIRTIYPLNRPVYRYDSLKQFNAEFGDPAAQAIKAAREQAAAMEAQVLKARIRTESEAEEEADELVEQIAVEIDPQSLPEQEKFVNVPFLGDALFERLEAELSNVRNLRIQDVKDAFIEAARDPLVRPIISAATGEQAKPLLHLIETAYEAYKAVASIKDREAARASFQAEISTRSGVGSQDASSAAEYRRATERRDYAYQNPAEARRRFVNLLDRVASLGYDVNLFQRRMDGIGQELFSLGSGSGAAVADQIVLVMDDIHSPDQQTLTALLHEVVHQFAKTMAPSQQALMHRAINRMSDEALGLDASPDARIRQSNPRNLPPEQLAHELLAEYFALEGVGTETLDAPTLADRLWRFLKGLYLRASIAVQQMLFGEEAVRPETALAYFDNRLQAWLNGGIAQSFTSLFPAPQTLEGRIRTFEPVGPRWQPVGQLNWRSGKMEYGDILPETIEAMLVDAEFRSVGKLADPEEVSGEGNPTLRKTIDIAANNETEDTFQSMFQAYNQAHLNTASVTYEQFVMDILGWKGDMPSDRNAAANQALVANQKAPANPNVRLAQLSSGTFRGNATVKALKMLRGFRDSMRERRSEVERRIPIETARQQRRARRLRDVVDNYQNTQVLFGQVYPQIRQMFGQFKGQMRNYGRANFRMGMLGQALVDTQKDITTPLPKHYVQLVEKLAKEINGAPIKFIDTLMEVSHLNINWQQTPLYDLNGQPGIRSLIEIAGATNPKLADLIQDTKESRAKLAIVAAFARENDAMMTMMQVRQANNDAGYQQIKAMVDQSFSDTTDDLKETQKLLDKALILHAQAKLMFAAIQKLRAANYSLIAGIKRDEHFREAHDATRPSMDADMARLEKEIGVREPVHFFSGELLTIPSFAGATVEQLRNDPVNHVRFVAFDDNGKQKAEIDGWIKKANLWLAANPQLAGGAMFERISDIAHGLKMISADTRHYGIRRSALGYVLGSIADKLSNSGTASGRKAAERVYKYVSHVRGFSDFERIQGIKVAAAKGKAMSIMGLKDNEQFYRLFYDRAQKFIEANNHLAEVPNGADQVLAELRIYLRNDPDTRSLMKPGAADALTVFWKENAIAAHRMEHEVKRKLGVKTEDEAIDSLRDAIGDPLFTIPRSWNPRVAGLEGDMAPLWNGTTRQKLTPEFIKNAFANNPQAFAVDMNERFAGRVWKDFLRPLAYRTGSAVFSGDIVGGSWNIANRDQVINAFETAAGDPIAFAINLKALTGSQVPDAEYIAETLSTAQNFYNALANGLAESATPKNQEGMASIGLMNARIAESFPAEWMQYARFDQKYSMWTVQRLAYHAAFGRFGEAVALDIARASADLKTVAGNMKQIRDEVVAANAGKSTLRIDGPNGLLQAELKKRGLDVAKHLSAEFHMAEVQAAQASLDGWFDTQGEGLVETRAFLAVMHTITGLMVQGPKTVLIDTTTMFNSLLTLGVNKHALREIRGNWSHFASNAIGSLLQAVHVQWNWNLEQALTRERIGQIDVAGRVPFRDRIRAIAASEPNAIVRASKYVGEALTQLATQGPGPYAGLRTPTALFTQGSLWIHNALIESSWKTYEHFVSKATEYLRAHPQFQNRKDFTFTMGDLGFKKGIIFDSTRAFDYMIDQLHRNGMTLEGLANAALERQAVNPNDTRMFTEDQLQKLASVATNDLTSEGSIATNPTWMQNPMMRAFSLLLTWSIRRMGDLRNAYRAPTGELDWYTFGNGIKVTLALVPLGLAWAALIDDYDEFATGKKSNIRGFGEDNNFLAAVEQMTRIGMFGGWGDIGNTLGNMAGSGDLRGLSLDNRVVFVNSILAAMNAATTWVKQGEATYGTVYRPLAQAVGGSGYLQIAQILNHLLELDNPESRVTARINAQNYLRAAGRELNLDVRLGRAGVASLPNSIKPHVGEMLLAALADDAGDFYEAYREAVQAARDEGKPDAIDHVKRSFTAYHPIKTVFRTTPSSREYSQILSVLSDDGRRDVSESVQLFNRYASRLGIREFEGRKEKPFTRPRPLSAEQIRSRAFAF